MTSPATSIVEADPRADREQPRSVRPDAVWSVPSWVSSRCYELGTPSARAMITNARWWTSILLEDASAELWNLLPPHFTLSDLAPVLRSVGMEIDDAECRTAVTAFLETLRDEGLLWCDDGGNSQPDHPTAKAAFDAGGALNSIEAAFFDWLVDRRMLPTAMIELTYRCNQRCVHCFNPGAAHAPEERSRRHGSELSTAEVFALLRQLAESGVLIVTFSGGELSLRPDLIPILQEAKRLGFAFDVYTNGQLSEQCLRENLRPLAADPGNQPLFGGCRDTRRHDRRERIVPEGAGFVAVRRQDGRSRHREVPLDAAYRLRLQEPHGLVPRVERPSPVRSSHHGGHGRQLGVHRASDCR